jgi:endonuclease-3
MTVEEIKEIIRPCGLSPMKSKEYTVFPYFDRQTWRSPQSFEYLEELPAVGHKTASVVMSQAFRVAAFPVDTHIHRLMYRWNLTNGKMLFKPKRCETAIPRRDME